MKVAVLIEGQEGVSWQRWLEVVRWADELGFESLWRSDHVIPLANDRHVDSIDTFVALTHVAVSTSRIRFGCLVTPMTLRHPVTVARTAAAINELSSGRFMLGVGAGWYAQEHSMFGFPLPGPRRRVLALDEGAAVIRLLLTGETVSFDGEIFALSGARICPATPIPIVIGGGGERFTLRAVARHADEWNLPAVSMQVYRRKTDLLMTYCEQEGRDPASIGRSLVYTQAIRESEAEVRRATEALIADTPPAYRPGAGPEAPVWLLGTPKHVVEELLALQAQGVGRVMLQFRRPPSRHELELIATDVIPHV
jgi:alkanesulfonate monooxygenase SsuD/methylene tetrahydromethanopterin reductase-like flavin-dependent oxidoreductase (luciferase family)